MTYDEYKNTNSYKKAKSGSEVDVVLFLNDDPNFTPLARGAGLSYNETFERIPVEEYGESGVNEIADGKHALTGSITSFFIPEQNDRMDIRQTFQGREYTILEVIAQNPRTQADGTAGTVLGALLGVKFSGKGVDLAARGIRGMNAQFLALEYLNGQQYAEVYGS